MLWDAIASPGFRVPISLPEDYHGIWLPLIILSRIRIHELQELKF
jgi:hypothetical protein